MPDGGESEVRPRRSQGVRGTGFDISFSVVNGLATRGQKWSTAWLRVVNGQHAYVWSVALLRVVHGRGHVVRPHLSLDGVMTRVRAHTH